MTNAVSESPLKAKFKFALASKFSAPLICSLQVNCAIKQQSASRLVAALCGVVQCGALRLWCASVPNCHRARQVRFCCCCGQLLQTAACSMKFRFATQANYLCVCIGFAMVYLFVIEQNNKLFACFWYLLEFRLLVSMTPFQGCNNPLNNSQASKKKKHYHSNVTTKKRHACQTNDSITPTVDSSLALYELNDDHKLCIHVQG